MSMPHYGEVELVRTHASIAAFCALITPFSASITAFCTCSKSSSAAPTLSRALSLPWQACNVYFPASTSSSVRYSRKNANGIAEPPTFKVIPILEGRLMADMEMRSLLSIDSDGNSARTSRAST